ncbi:ABC transporter substrate-binding protein [Humitalea sp. 24SJ18S-53]|uniref:ABC transporter substrate-binding protein n=1 Tax=Humitalea sp. 24SJ18S-53 TaxID=3422307 RepID=UPI003D666C9B
MTKITRRLTLTTAAILAAAAPRLNAWAADPTPEEVAAAARREGRLIIYTSSVDADMQKLSAGFERTYPGIRVEWIRQPSTTVFNRFVGEVEAGVVQADLLYTASTALFQERPELFRPLTPAMLPNMGADAAVRAKNAVYVIDAVSPHVVSYSTRTVTPQDLTQLRSWRDLTNPRWRGKIALVDPKISTNITSWLLVMRDTYGADWVRAFGQNGIQVVGTGTAGVQQAVAGAYQLVVPTVLSHSAELRARRAPLGILQPEGPAHGLENGAAIPVRSNHPNAALLWTNWKFSREAQNLIASMGLVAVKPVDDPNAPKLSPNHIGSNDTISVALQRELIELVGLRS